MASLDVNFTGPIVEVPNKFGSSVFELRDERELSSLKCILESEGFAVGQIPDGITCNGSNAGWEVRKAILRLRRAASAN